MVAANPVSAMASLLLLAGVPGFAAADSAAGDCVGVSTPMQFLAGIEDATAQVQPSVVICLDASDTEYAHLPPSVYFFHLLPMCQTRTLAVPAHNAADQCSEVCSFDCGRARRYVSLFSRASWTSLRDFAYTCLRLIRRLNPRISFTKTVLVPFTSRLPVYRVVRCCTPNPCANRRPTRNVVVPWSQCRS